MSEAGRPRRVLIVEDESVLRTNMVRGLAKLPDLDVKGAGTVQEALALCAQEPPDLVISDIDLPDRLGIELIGEFRGRGLPTRIVFISAYLKAYQSQIPPHAGVDVYEKPISMEQLRQVVQEKLSECASPFNPFGVSEYLQLAALGRHSVRVEVKGREAQGQITVVDGDPWTAVDAEGEGLEAFLRLAVAKSCAVSCSTLQGDPGLRSLEGTMDSLLLEAACRADETTAPACDPPQESLEETRFQELVDLGIAHTLEKRYAEALEAFQSAQRLRSGDRRVEANIARLTQLLAPL